jgi:putative lipase involved disintegration of autophagic bodies
VFATPDNSTVVLSIKGTSGGWLGGGGPTIKKDKFNDNLLFSCCCAYVDWTWTVSMVFMQLKSALTLTMVHRPYVTAREVDGRYENDRRRLLGSDSSRSSATKTAWKTL